MSAATLVDAHVHLYPCFAPGVLLNAAARNVAVAARALGLAPTTPGVLLLTETPGLDAFAALAAGRLDGGPWRVAPTAEPVALRATCAAHPPLVIVAGRQVTSAEGLEVLTLGLRNAPDEGRPAAEVIRVVSWAGALAVLPWGFGKWIGRRRKPVEALFAEAPERLYAGDNGGRPALLPRPRLFAHAERHGRLVLPGSDPLPLAAEVAKPGRFGFVAELALDPERPFASLAHWLATRRTSPRPYGRLERPDVFLCRQVALRLASGPRA